jgi:hypothetical protein
VWAGAAWIGGGSELRTDARIPAGKVKSARAYAAGVGVMELHLNGAKVAAGLYQTVTSQCSSTALYRVSYRVQYG